MVDEKMKSFYKELKNRKEYLIKKLWKEQADNEWSWCQKEISLKEYIVRDWNIKTRIKELEG